MGSEILHFKTEKVDNDTRRRRGGGRIKKKIHLGQNGVTGGRDQTPDVIYLNRQTEFLETCITIG